MLQGLIIVNTLLYLSIRVVVRWKLAWPGGGPLPGCDQTTQRLRIDHFVVEHYLMLSLGQLLWLFAPEKVKTMSFFHKVPKADLPLIFGFVTPFLHMVVRSTGA